MSKGGGRSGVAKGGVSSGAAVSVGGIVSLPNGMKAVKIRVGGKTVLVPAGGDASKKVQQVQQKIRNLGSGIVGSVTPKAGGKAQVSLSGPNGAITLLGAFPP